jgi:hypothetical protein
VEERPQDDPEKAEQQLNHVGISITGPGNATGAAPGTLRTRISS